MTVKDQFGSDYRLTAAYVSQLYPCGTWFRRVRLADLAPAVRRRSYGWVALYLHNNYPAGGTSKFPVKAGWFPWDGELDIGCKVFLGDNAQRIVDAVRRAAKKKGI